MVNKLSEEEKLLLSRIKHTDTQVGIVGVLSFQTDIPRGW